MRAEILDRLVCAKYLFHDGIEILEQGGPYSAGRAVLAFHDAVELVLRTVAEALHASLKENMQFNQLLDDVERVAGTPLTHRSALFQMNRARVNFKHSGLLPRNEDVRKFRNDLEGFFSTILPATLDVDFNRLSLANSVRHQRCSNWLVKAEDAIEREDYEASLYASSVAFAVLRCSRPKTDFSREFERALRYSSTRTRQGVQLPESVLSLAENIGKELDKLHEHLELISAGVPVDEYLRFRHLTPRVLLSAAGTIHAEGRHSQATYESALFCVSFVVGAALRYQRMYEPDPFERIPMTRRFRATKPGAVIVYPEDSSEEVIRTFVEGDEFVGYYDKRDMPGYVGVLQDGECCYVSSECVEKIA